VIISSLLYSKHPSELKFVFIDPKTVEFTPYNPLLKHYLAVLPTAADEEDEKRKAIVKKAKDAEQVLSSLCIEMDERYELLAKGGVNDFKLYNEKYKDRYLLPTEGHRYLPYLVVVVDEYADLIMAGGSSPDDKKSAKNIEAAIIRLAQKGRAAGIHVIIATQRPSVNVITGLIKANFPTRIAFRVLSGVDSRTILDSVGAENLIGKGDMLYYAGVKMERIQCAYISMEEINRVTKFIGNQTKFGQCYNTPFYLPMPESPDGSPAGGSLDIQTLDSEFEEAARTVVMSQKGSTSDLQRKLGMGYARAGRVMDQLEQAGIVGPQEGSKPRQVLVSTLDELDEISAHLILYDDGQAVATARFYVQDDCAYLGRIAVLKEKRGMGFGDLLLKVMMQKIQRMEVPMLEIHAQLHAVPFYARYGFEVQGEEYILDGLPHLTMRVASENCQYPALCGKH
jgi:S-DNA-T family DNA segregation ATPase FtsK/SpoIIIE